MKIKQKIAALLLIVTSVSLVATAQMSVSASALTCTILPQSICNDAGNKNLQAGNGQSGNSGIWDILLLVLNILTAGVGIVAVGALGFAGFLYSTAGGDEGKVKKAKEMILNTVIGIVAYGLMYVGLNFLIPGGVFK